MSGTAADGPDFEPKFGGIGWRQVLQSLVGFAIAGALLVWGLPRVAETTWPEIGHQLTLVGWPVAALMMALMLIGLYCYTYTLIGSLPGLTHFRALMVNAAGSMVSNILPAGGAVGVALTYMMYRTWGFTKRNISTSLVVTGVWNLLARLVLPVLACLVILVGPVNAPRSVLIGSGIAAAIGLAILGLFIAVIYSDKVSHLVGRAVGRLARPFSRRVREGRDFDHLIQDQRDRMSNVVGVHGVRMTLGLAGMFGFFFVLYAVACHAVGVELPYVEMFAAYAFRQFLTVVAITPGGLGITEAGTAGVLVAFGAEPASAASAALLYAVFTHLLEVPLGIGAVLLWWFGPNHPTTEQLGAGGEELVPTESLPQAQPLDTEPAPDATGAGPETGPPPDTP
ncbi:lysylphosphatidylglycerol synthase transmembrane domain-containing protein [Ornithinicoccus hortensis]|uniref:Uncharacterized membrane protein YbhN (UPF0104 family) n=1 Tax=Ornithinicoccus hortensis TaxID=82346 RepID=A0A542YQ33_9MICO|nr:lysylphosphatidylglycerol synthase transmembrane domain-containing protein [Ornithinicoccus hortensis]TQL50218.1 uncharacterized membrane protein YbhN (UPF0104 family) [Ornithinicoccus hortensis]